jgi:glycosyltransferase involved in cell wall biosynthesis
LFSTINSHPSTGSYVIITPVRNEGQYLQKTVDSVVSQTLKPQKWIIVNDGSTDNTRQLIDEAAKQHSWIQAVHRPDRGFRNPGSGVIEAFNDGYRLLGEEPWDCLVKLDGDLSFAPAFFASCLARFDADPRLGIGGGTICGEVHGILRQESQGDPPFHVRGATKIYRRACWQAIGGLIQAPGWDTLDEVKANMLGWRTCSFPELKLLHYRYTGDADGVWKNWVKNGRANYIVGYHPLFMFFKCARRLFDWPYGIVSAGLWYGFVTGYLFQIPRNKEPDVIRYLRRQQLRRLLFRPSIWAGR